jgi:hypothetical protein
MEVYVKYHRFLLMTAILILSGCTTKPTPEIAGSTSTPVPTSNPTMTATLTVSPTVPQPTPEPVTVLAYCTLLGREANIHIPSGSPVFIEWGWKASTEAQVQDYIDNAEAVITLDGIKLDGAMDDAISREDSTGQFFVNWTSDVGVLSPGTHEMTYDVSWKRMIFDGTDNYGPGGTYETIRDECRIMVE